MGTLPVATTRMTFDDEFNTFSNSPNGSSGTWMTSYPYGGEAARTLSGNSEAEYYSDSSVGENPFKDSNGVLTISATPAANGSNPYGLPYDSGLITTYGSFSQTYGYFEVSAQLPSEQGLWPAFWMLPANNQYTSELDVFEAVDNQPNTIYSTVHGTTNGVWGSDSQAFTVPNQATGFHTYGVDWEPTTTTYYVDGKEIGSAPTPTSMNDPMYMLLNLAVGGQGSWPGAPDGSTTWPANMKIDWVRAFATANTTYVGGSAAIPNNQTNPIKFGSGPDSIVLSISEDAWQGNALYTVAIDGKQVGGTLTATATRAASQTQSVTIDGNWGTGAHTVGITFINDAYGGSPSTDRNLFVNSASYDGKSMSPSSASLFKDGTANMTAASAGPGTVTALLSEDAYQGNAAFSIEVDGNQVSSGSVSALNSAGQSEAFNLPGVLAAGSHEIAVSFLNDLYGGTPTTDRNLYVKGIDVNGTLVANSSATMDSNGTSYFSVYVPQNT